MSNVELMQAKNLMQWYEDKLRRLRIEVVEFEIETEDVRRNLHAMWARCNDAAAYFDHEVAA
jgi:hypothetical protein